MTYSEVMDTYFKKQKMNPETKQYEPMREVTSFYVSQVAEKEGKAYTALEKMLVDEGYTIILNEKPFIPHGPVTTHHDAVVHPSHYNQGGIECMDAIEAALGMDGYKAWLTGTIIKYMWRWQHKNGVEDLKKAQFYTNKLIELVSPVPNDK